MTTVPTPKPPTVKPTAVTAEGALKLAAWIAAAHPKLFRKVLKLAQAQKQAAAKTANLIQTPSSTPVQVKLSGLGACGCGCGGACGANCPGCANAKVTSLSAYRARRVSGLGSLSSSLSDIASSIGSATSSEIASAVSSAPSSSSGGFWSSLGSDLASAGSAALSGIKDVGSYLTTGGGLGALTGLANDYFTAKSQSAIANAQAQQQQAILQAQAQAVAQGGVPAPISYATNAYGQQVPVYANGSTYGMVTPSYLSSLSSGPNSIMTYLPWILGGGLALVVVAKLL